jgi:transaldolase
MFSVEVYRQVAMAYINGLRRRLASGQDISRVASVASFFVSRVDTKVDKILESVGTEQALSERGTAAVANARLAYEAYLEIFHGAEFADLKAAGAQVQRCLWASTSTKNPNYRDIKYVDELMGPETVDTMPLETIHAFLDHGDPRRTLDEDLHEAHEAIRLIEAQGVSMAQATAELLSEGVVTFAKSFDELIASIDSKREALAPA